MARMSLSSCNETSKLPKSLEMNCQIANKLAVYFHRAEGRCLLEQWFISQCQILYLGYNCFYSQKKPSQWLNHWDSNDPRDTETLFLFQKRWMAGISTESQSPIESECTIFSASFSSTPNLTLSYDGEDTDLQFGLDQKNEFHAYQESERRLALTARSMFVTSTLVNKRSRRFLWNFGIYLIGVSQMKYIAACPRDHFFWGKKIVSDSHSCIKAVVELEPDLVTSRRRIRKQDFSVFYFSDARRLAKDTIDITVIIRRPL
jgi:hypothetical protein